MSDLPLMLTVKTLFSTIHYAIIKVLNMVGKKVVYRGLHEQAMCACSQVFGPITRPYCVVTSWRDLKLAHFVFEFCDARSSANVMRESPCKKLSRHS